MSGRVKGLGKKIEERKQETLGILQDVKELAEEEAERIRKNRTIEQLKYRQFVKSITGKRFFSIEDINALNLPYNICIHISAKGVGKTVEIYRMIRKVIEKREKFMYGRVYKKELDNEAEEFNTRPESPVYAIKYRDNWYYYTKESVNRWQSELEEELEEKQPTLPKLRRAGIEYVGKGYTFRASNCLSGGAYEGYNTIFFDEILSYNPENRINANVLKAWDASVHTIQRNKNTVKIYLFGNLQDQAVSPILNHYTIDIDDNLRYIERGDIANGAKILFVNSKGIYGNSIGHKGGAAHHAPPERQVFLKHNKVILPTGNIMTPGIFGEMEYVTAFALTSALGEICYIELRKVEENKKTYYCASCQQMKITTMGKGPIYAQDPLIYNKFTSIRKCYSIEPGFNAVYTQYKYGELYYDCYNSMEMLGNAINANLHLAYEYQF